MAEVPKHEQQKNLQIIKDSKYTKQQQIIKTKIQAEADLKKKVKNREKIWKSQQPISDQQGLKVKENQKNTQFQPKSKQKKSKLKKTQHKCIICRTQGKKCQMIKCSVCKHYTHLSCLEQNELTKRYTCIKCKDGISPKQTRVALKEQKKFQKIQQAKVDQKKQQKIQKKKQLIASFKKFKDKYGYYVHGGDKIKFPIEDKLLYIYKQIFQVPQFKIFPTNHPTIPSQYLGDFLEIENFLVSFSMQIESEYNGQYRKSILYKYMNSQGSDRVFQKIIATIIKIYLKDIYEKNKTQNVKILNDNSFFILLSNIIELESSSSDFLVIICPEIIRQLSTVPSMKNAFFNFVFPKKLNLKQKLKTIIALIQGLSQVDAFHDMMSRKSQRLSEINKDKTDIVTKLKKNEVDALTRQECLKQVLIKVNKFQQNKIQKSVNRKENRSLIKQLQKSKRESQKLINEGKISQKIIKDFRQKIKCISKQIPFMLSEVIYLGRDRNQSCYYFYLRQPYRIYVRYKAYILQQSWNFKVFEGKQKILQFLKALNVKGVNQRRLYDTINNLLKQQIIKNLTQQQKLQQNSNQQLQYLGKCVSIESEQDMRKSIIFNVMNMEQKFSNFLAIKNYQWGSKQKRQQFRFGFPFIQNIQALKQQIKNLHDSFLFVEVLKQKQMSDSNDLVQPFLQADKQLFKKKKPIRIWGVNIEKKKKFWVQYLQNCVNLQGIWMCVAILQKHIQKYLQKRLLVTKKQEESPLFENQKQKYKNKPKKKQAQNEYLKMTRLRSRGGPKHSKKPKQVILQLQSSSEQPRVRTRRAALSMKQKKAQQKSEDQQYKADQSKDE